MRYGKFTTKHAQHIKGPVWRTKRVAKAIRQHDSVHGEYRTVDSSDYGHWARENRALLRCMQCYEQTRATHACNG